VIWSFLVEEIFIPKFDFKLLASVKRTPPIFVLLQFLPSIASSIELNLISLSSSNQLVSCLSIVQQFKVPFNSSLFFSPLSPPTSTKFHLISLCVLSIYSEWTSFFTWKVFAVLSSEQTRTPINWIYDNRLCGVCILNIATTKTTKTTKHLLDFYFVLSFCEKWSYQSD